MGDHSSALLFDPGRGRRITQVVVPHESMARLIVGHERLHGHFDQCSRSSHGRTDRTAATWCRGSPRQFSGDAHVSHDELEVPLDDRWPAQRWVPPVLPLLEVLVTTRSRPRITACSREEHANDCDHADLTTASRAHGCGGGSRTVPRLAVPVALPRRARWVSIPPQVAVWSTHTMVPPRKRTIRTKSFRR